MYVDVVYNWCIEIEIGVNEFIVDVKIVLYKE